MRISIISPVLNESQFIGYSIMAALPHVHEILYGVGKSTDGTIELLSHIKNQYAGDKLKLFTDVGAEVELPQIWSFDPMDMKAYNYAFNYLIEKATGDAIWFLHPDMIITKWGNVEEGPLAWTVNVTSYAKDLNTQITKGRCSKWKNLHANHFGLHYYGGYGSANEDFYHKDISANAYKHYGTEFSKYPFEVADSGISINHYCELKPYKRRLEKMKLCLKTQNPNAIDAKLDEMAFNHPRVTLEQSSNQFGEFEFSESKEQIPEVFSKYKAEFEPFTKELVYG